MFKLGGGGGGGRGVSRNFDWASQWSQRPSASISHQSPPIDTAEDLRREKEAPASAEKADKPSSNTRKGLYFLLGACQRTRTLL